MAEPGNGDILGKAGPGRQKPFEGVRPGKRTLSQDIVSQGPQVGSPEYQSRLGGVMEILRKLGPKEEPEKEKTERVSEEEARRAWMEHYKGRELKGEELQTVNWLIKLGYKPDSKRSPFQQAADYLLSPDTKEGFQRQTEELAKLVPEQRIVAQKRKELGEEGMPEKNRYRLQIDTTGITNAALREQLDLINNIGEAVGHNRLDIDFLTRRLEQIPAITVPADQQDQLATIRQRITDLIRGQRQLDEQIREAQRIENRERGQYYTAEQLEAIRTNPEEREQIFEQIFAGPDAAPGLPFDRVFSFNEQGRWAEFIQTLTATGDLRLTHEFSARREIRGILHDANWGVSGGGNIQAFANAAQTYKDEYTDLIFQDPLVESALHFFEQGFQQIRADNNGQLPYEKLEWNFKREGDRGPGSDLEDIVWDEMRNAVQNGVIKDVVRDGNGKIVLGPDGKPQLRPVSKDILERENAWRMQRAIVLARGFGVLSLRFPEIAAEARLPEATALSDANVGAHRSASIYGESVSAYLDPMEHLIEKFGIGIEDRAILYYFLTGDKRKIQNKKDLVDALEYAKSQFRPEDKRLIDQINYFRTGGPFSRSSWRQRVSFEKLPDETEDEFKIRLKRAGVGVLEARVSGDVEDQIKKEVRGSPEFVKYETDKEIESNPELTKKFRKAVEARKKEFIPGEVDHLNKSMRHEEYLLLEKRVDMWKDTLRRNPLRVMWEWEKRETEDKKNPGQRVRFLSEALQVNEDVARELIDGVEKNLMLIQEEVVSSRKPIPANPNEEMLNFDLITDDTQRQNVRLYVDKIREKAAEGDYRFFKDVLLKHSPVTDTPFPFVVGFEDIPFAEYDFIKSGGRGMSRKINDFASAYTASVELINLINGIGTAQNMETMVQHLVKIKEQISRVDAELARELMPPLAEGIIRMYKKDALAKLPLGIGTFIGMTGDTSFVQRFKGMGAMTIDEGDIYAFTKHLSQNSLISLKELEKFRWKVGGTVFHAGLDFFRTYGQLLLLVMALEFASRTAKGK